MTVIHDFEKDKLSLTETVARLAVATNEWEAQKSSYAQLKLKYDKLLQDRSLFQAAVEAAQATRSTVFQKSK